jgi:hypothetical protein
LANARLPDNVVLDGRPSIAPARDDAAARTWVYAEHEGKCFVRSRRWKLYNDNQFFDMIADPDEQHSLNVTELSRTSAVAYAELQRAMTRLGCN